ncbi:MAG TPA: hypothetical protein VJY15_11305 [Candidatus Acidoferrum sp.]|nr:hypothetical protein [Candidatus Acidoferrum sp.]
MTELEKRAIRSLRDVKMPKWSWHARRTESFYWLMALDPSTRLDSEQAGDLWYLVWRYRRQIADCEVVVHANELVNGAMSLAFQ